MFLFMLDREEGERYYTSSSCLCTYTAWSCCNVRSWGKTSRSWRKKKKVERKILILFILGMVERKEDRDVTFFMNDYIVTAQWQHPDYVISFICINKPPGLPLLHVSQKDGMQLTSPPLEGHPRVKKSRRKWSDKSVEKYSTTSSNIQLRPEQRYNGYGPHPKSIWWASKAKNK